MGICYCPRLLLIPCTPLREREIKTPHLVSWIFVAVSAPLGSLVYSRPSLWDLGLCVCMLVCVHAHNIWLHIQSSCHLIRKATNQGRRRREPQMYNNAKKGQNAPKDRNTSHRPLTFTLPPRHVSIHTLVVVADRYRKPNHEDPTQVPGIHHSCKWDCKLLKE